MNRSRRQPLIHGCAKLECCLPCLEADICLSGTSDTILPWRFDFHAFGSRDLVGARLYRGSNSMADRNQEASVFKEPPSGLGGAAALASKAEYLKRFHDALNILRETMERRDHLFARQSGLVSEDQAIG
jgi:hypothetical protein